MKFSEKDYYQTLNVSINASQETIKDQYRSLAKVRHPDMFKSPTDKAKAEAEMKEINEAYSVLGNPKKRAEYNIYFLSRGSRTHKQEWRKEEAQRRAKEEQKQREQDEAQKRREEAEQRYRNEKEAERRAREEQRKKKEEDDARHYDEYMRGINLTEEEKIILELLGIGLTSTEIADRVKLSDPFFQNLWVRRFLHINRISHTLMTKFEVKNIYELVKRAKKYGHIH